MSRTASLTLLAAILWASAVRGQEEYAIFSSPREPLLDRLAQGHADSMARRQHQDHDGFAARMAEAKRKLGGEYAEICAESWPRQRDAGNDELWADAFRSWSFSPGHWRVASRRHKRIGAGRAMGRNGIHYTCILAGD